MIVTKGSDLNDLVSVSVDAPCLVWITPAVARQTMLSIYSEKMLGKLLDYDAIHDDDAAALAEDWTIDHWPQRARELLVIRRRRTGDEVLVMQDVPPAYGDNDLDSTVAALRLKARGNPALARALRNLNRTLDGHVDVID